VNTTEHIHKVNQHNTSHLFSMHNIADMAGLHKQLHKN